MLFESRPRFGGKLIRIDIDAEQLVRNALPDVAIASDAALALKALLEELQTDVALASAATRARSP
jgi:acetolactate synthase-1/2/3 large subunit